VTQVVGTYSIWWMTRDQLNEAIPPAYAEHVGLQLMAALTRAGAGRMSTGGGRRSAPCISTPAYRPSPNAPQYKTAGQYTGWAADPGARLAEHETGRGARPTQVQLQPGGSWRLADVQPGTRAGERRLKQHGAARRCPIRQTELEERRRDQAAESTSQARRPGTSPA
jgi:hypothetical protein